MRVGDQIVVVGNPEGLEQTVSNGLVSGIRELITESSFRFQRQSQRGAAAVPCSMIAVR